MKKIKDTAGYIAYIYPKSLVFGICDFCYQYSCDSFGLPQKIPYWSYVEMIIFVAVIIWFSNMLRNAREKFVKF